MRERERDTDDIFINKFLLMIAASTNLSFDSILQNRLRIVYIIRLEFLFQRDITVSFVRSES